MRIAETCLGSKYIGVPNVLRKVALLTSPEEIERVVPEGKRVRILLAKPALDGHDRGLLILARAFRDAGFEVIYGGILRSPDEVVDMALQEDVDAVALSLHNNAHIPAFTRVSKLLRERGAEDILIIGGGIIPPEDRKLLESYGISGNFGPGTPLKVIIDHVMNRVREERWRKR